MGNLLKKLNPALKNFIENQKIFFVGTARASGTINVSPKGMDTFRIVKNNKIVWLNLTGSGNETAAHLL
jgi:predicted pyridoxine 5'-phosphate oxidase superfamily flavin-nucleotide-binding protein